MSEERSYYEIALTNRQVAFAIGTLLLCVVGAFIAGLWVAREALGDTVSAGPRLARDGGERPFAFFEESGEDGDSGVSESGAEAPGVAEPEIPVQRVRTDDLDDASTVAEPVEEESPPPTVTRGDADADGAADDPPASAPDPEPAEEEPRAVPVEVRASDPESTAPSASGDVVIQVFSSADRAQAEALLARLEQAGYSAFMDPLENGSRTMFRVRVGPYASRDVAETAADELRKEFRVETWITSR